MSDPFSLPALLVTRSAVSSDAALQSAGRGARKLVVTELYGDTEVVASQVAWRPPQRGEKCPVLVKRDYQVAFFNHTAKQDRHFHQAATEIYSVIEGVMLIEVEGNEHNLHAGDMLIVNPGAIHEVKPNANEFLCSVITLKSAGASDKIEV